MLRWRGARQRTRPTGEGDLESEDAEDEVEQAAQEAHGTEEEHSVEDARLGVSAISKFKQLRTR